ncbi:hypothetical protein CRG98_042332 [Punica granatum]|uniref:Aminotransferase-like plant mobile domain-containing protein n=1 Tax=Punica granatum TaxID=22663 RepID=A0A2I0I0K1_PUNGR|nr:hypothetical protein CRG98_042332 [Punica granatum]
MDRPAPGLRLEAITPPRQEIMRIWRTLRPVDRTFIQGIIGDMVMFTETPVDWIFLRTAIEFWDPEHAVFNFQGTELAPTIEEYTALIQWPMPTTQGIFMPNPFAVIRRWDHGIRIAWLSDWTLLRALTPSTASYQRDASHGFLLLIFGTLLFPYSPNLIDGAIAQVVLQAVGGHSYVEALLAETIWIFPPRRTAYPTASSGPTLHQRPLQDSCKSGRSIVNGTLAPYSVCTSPSTPPTKNEHSPPHQHTWPSSIHRDRRHRNGRRPPRLPELHLPPFPKPKAPPKRLCEQSYGPSGRNEIGSVASLLTLAWRSRTTGSFKRSKSQLASHRYPTRQRLRMAEEDRVDISEEVNPPVPAHSQPPPTHAPPPPTSAGILPAYSGAPPPHVPPPTSSGASLPRVTLTSSASDDQARITALEGTVNQLAASMAANMAELFALLRGPNRASSSSTPPPGQGATVDLTPWSSSGRRGKEVSVNAVNQAHPTPQQYSVNLTTAPTSAPAYFPSPPQHQPQSIYYSTPPVSPPMTSQPYDHHYAPASTPPPQPRPSVSRAPPPAQQNPTSQGQVPENIDAPAPPTLHTSMAHPFTSPFPPLPAPTAVPLPPVTFLSSEQALSAPPPISISAPTAIYTVPPPMANPLPDHRPNSGPSINMITICTSGRDEDTQDNPLPLVIDYTPDVPTVGFAGHMASPAPFFVDIPVREPYSDNKVPWTYEGGIRSVEQQFSVMGVTRSG